MKKFLQIAFVMIVSLCYVSNVNAATEQDLIDYASKTVTINGKSVNSPELAAIVKSYLADNDIDATTADKIIADADKIIELMQAEGVTDPTQLSKASKDKVLSLANEIADLAGADFTYDSTTKSITVIGPNGKVYGSVKVGKPRLASTGADYTVYVAISGIALAISAVALYRKSKVNA